MLGSRRKRGSRMRIDHARHTYTNTRWSERGRGQKSIIVIVQLWFYPASHHCDTEASRKPLKLKSVIAPEPDSTLRAKGSTRANLSARKAPRASWTLRTHLRALDAVSLHGKLIVPYVGTRLTFGMNALPPRLKCGSR
jgi:hypothetical protein